MSRARQGDRVKIHYTEKLKSGRVLDTSKGESPLEIKIGRGIIPLFETAVEGMEIGQKKAVSIPPEKAHGPWREELKFDVKKSDLPKNVSPNVGHELTVQKTDGSHVNAVIVEMNKDTVTLDINHPLAGESLIFDIELVEIT
jgi:FKBP-type peptidyl-prolyl cis-trans isomerase 2